MNTLLCLFLTYLFFRSARAVTFLVRKVTKRTLLVLYHLTYLIKEKHHEHRLYHK